MRILKIILPLLALISIASCEEVEGTVSIKNNISNSEISDVKFGDYTVAYSLLPGQDNSLTIYDTKDEFPKTGQVSFTMSANDKVVYLVTLNDFELNEGAELNIVLSDSTRVE